MNPQTPLFIAEILSNLSERIPIHFGTYYFVNMGFNMLQILKMYVPTSLEINNRNLKMKINIKVVIQINYEEINHTHENKIKIERKKKIKQKY